MVTPEEIKQLWGDIPAEWLEIELKVAQIMQRAGDEGLSVNDAKWESKLAILNLRHSSALSVLNEVLPESFKGRVRPSDRKIVAELVYDHLKLLPAPRLTEKGARSVSKDALAMVQDHPVVMALQSAQHAQAELSFAQSASEFLTLD